MDNKGANIDVVFRNGLKDFEVLPPPEIWANVYPNIKRKHRPFILLRVAALITVVISMSFLAYRMSMDGLKSLESPVMTLNEESESPVKLSSTDKPLAVAIQENNPLIRSQRALVEDVEGSKIQPEEEKLVNQDVAYFQEINVLPFTSKKPSDRLLLASMKSSSKVAFKIESIDQQYVPDNIPIIVPDRWSVAAMASPTYYSRFSSGNDQLSKQLMASEQPVISYSGGVALSYKINKRFSVQTGLYYSSLGQEVEGVNSFGGFQKYDYTKGDHNFEVLTSSGSIYTNNADVFLNVKGQADRIITNYTNDVFDPEKASLQYINNTLLQNFSYLELPVILRYKVIDKTVDFNLIGGVSYNLLVKNSVYTLLDGAKYPIGKTEGLNTISISSSLGMGMEYNFSENFSLNLEPTFRYYLNPFNEVSGSKIHPYSFGIFSGLSYRF